MMLVMREV